MTALAASPDDLPRWQGHYKELRTSRNHALDGRGRDDANLLPEGHRGYW
jgi:hypothetical protein